MGNDYENTYIYNSFDIENGCYKSITAFNKDEYHNEIELGIRTNRYVFLQITKSTLPKCFLTEKLFYEPYYKFILDKALNDNIKKLNSLYFKDNHYYFLCYIILNLHKQHLEDVEENALIGIENDFKTLETQKKYLFKILERFTNRYKLNKKDSPQLLKARFTFTNGSSVETIQIDNFLILDDILSTFLEKYEFNPNQPEKWKGEINKYLVGFNVEKFERKLRVDFSKLIYSFLASNMIIEKSSSILNLGLKIINIIFSLASVPINNDTVFYNKRASFNRYHSLKQLDVLSKWISRN